MQDKNKTNQGSGLLYWCLQVLGVAKVLALAPRFRETRSANSREALLQGCRAGVTLLTFGNKQQLESK